MSCNPAYTVWKPVNTFSFIALCMKGGGEGCNYQVLLPIKKLQVAAVIKHNNIYS